MIPAEGWVGADQETGPSRQAELSLPMPGASDRQGRMAEDFLTSHE
jgi:hypothetical protein